MPTRALVPMSAGERFSWKWNFSQSMGKTDTITDVLSHTATHVYGGDTHADTLTLGTPAIDAEAADGIPASQSVDMSLTCSATAPRGARWNVQVQVRTSALAEFVLGIDVVVV